VSPKEGTMYECSECGKPYQSRSGLRRHMKREHPEPVYPRAVEAEQAVEIVPVAVEIVAGLGEDEEEPALGEGDNFVGPSRAELAEARVEGDEMVFHAALEALRIDADSVMASSVYADRVVIIEGPVGQKRVWMRED